MSLEYFSNFLMIYTFSCTLSLGSTSSSPSLCITLLLFCLRYWNIRYFYYIHTRICPSFAHYELKLFHIAHGESKFCAGLPALSIMLVIILIVYFRNYLISYRAATSALLFIIFRFSTNFAFFAIFFFKSRSHHYFLVDLWEFYYFLVSQPD
jgi:hypothetical protein